MKLSEWVENIRESSGRLSLGLSGKTKKKFADRDSVSNLDFDFVDLGLPSGNLWCKHNYGAKSESDLGEYFTYREALALSLDCGMVPSSEDFIDLCDGCKTEFTSSGGTIGVRFFSKTNGNSIFLPIEENGYAIYLSSTMQDKRNANCLFLGGVTYKVNPKDYFLASADRKKPLRVVCNFN